MDKHGLGPKIRQGIRDGVLPTRPPSRTWFGFAQGATSCAACGQPVQNRELECEAEFPDESRTWLFHAACFEVWEAERAAVLTCLLCGRKTDGVPTVTMNGDRAHPPCAADPPPTDASSVGTSSASSLPG